jgi:plasmid stability protein
MASLTIRNLDEAVKQGLRRRAAERGVSMEEEARAVLRAATLLTPGPRDLGAAIRARFAPLGGVELGHRIPPREGGRLVPFTDWPEDADDNADDEHARRE